MNAIILLGIGGVLVLFAGAFQVRRAILPLTILVLLGALTLLTLDKFAGLPNWYAWDKLTAMLAFDGYALAFSSLLTALTLIIALLCHQHYARHDSNIADIYGLLLFTLAGGICMVSFTDLTMLFVGLEILSISLYILAGSRKLDLHSNEASIKYFLMGSFATGMLLLGIALIYGATATQGLVITPGGTFSLPGIMAYANANAGQMPWMFTVGILLMIVGLGFKISAVPFHFWAPDVYQGSPTLVTAFMATVVKAAAIGGFYRLMAFLPHNHDGAYYTIYAMSALTILVGNLMAMRQRSAKRVLAYSGIANAGYMLAMLLLARDGNTASATLFYYAAAYGLATLGAFAVIMAVERTRGGDHAPDFRELSRTNPLLSLVLTICMLSLAGIPPLAGFIAKYYLFIDALRGDLLPLVLLSIAGSLMGVFYYFRLMIAAYQSSDEPMEPIQLFASYRVVLVGIAVLVVLIGLLPGVVRGLIS